MICSFSDRPWKLTWLSLSMLCFLDLKNQELAYLAVTLDFQTLILTELHTFTLLLLKHFKITTKDTFSFIFTVSLFNSFNEILWGLQA